MISESKAYYFNFEVKQWKPLPSVAQLEKQTRSCFCAERIGNYLFLAGQNQEIHRYDVVNNSWVELPKYGNNHEVNCLCSVGDYLYAISESNPLQRYSLTNNSWQGGEGLKVGGNKEKLSTVSATVMNSKIYVIHGYKIKRETPVGSINQLWFIVLTQNIMCGRNWRQPAVLILNPVFLLSTIDFVWQGG